MKCKQFYALLVFAALCSVVQAEDSPLSFRITSGVNIPIAGDEEFFTMGGGANLRGAFTLPAPTFLAVGADIGYSFAPLNTATFSWNGPAAGTHNLRFVVDPDNNIMETNENNNYYGFDLAVAQAPEAPVPEPEEDPMGLVPFIVIPVVILLLLLLLLLLFVLLALILLHSYQPRCA